MRTLSYGVQKNDVKILQAVLNSQGILGADGKVLEIDGVFGENTKYAVKVIQKRAKAYGMNMPVDGICGPETWAQLITERA